MREGIFAKKKVLLVGSALTGVIVVLVALVIMLAIRLHSAPLVTVPSDVQERLLFPIYAPAKAPDGYAQPPGTVTRAEDVLIFYLERDTKRIVFTQQATPKEYDLEAFYKEHLSKTKRVAGTPYLSVLGTGKDGSRVLSVAAPDTWLLVTAKDVPDDDLRFIARHIQPLQ